MATNREKFEVISDLLEKLKSSSGTQSIEITKKIKEVSEVLGDDSKAVPVEAETVVRA